MPAESARVKAAGLRAGLRAAWARLRGGELTPWRAGASVAVGALIGLTPLYGAHLPLVLAVCLLLKLDARVGAVASNVSIPPTAPFIAVAEIQLGALVRTGHALPFDRAALHARGLAAFAADLALGAALLAPAGGLALGALTWLVMAVAARLRRGAKAPPSA